MSSDKPALIRLVGGPRDGEELEVPYLDAEIHFVRSVEPKRVLGEAPGRPEPVRLVVYKRGTVDGLITTYVYDIVASSA